MLVKGRGARAAGSVGRAYLVSYAKFTLDLDARFAGSRAGMIRGGVGRGQASFRKRLVGTELGCLASKGS